MISKHIEIYKYRNPFRYKRPYTEGMSRKPSKSYEQFEQACLELVGEGRTITFSALKDKLGGGSNELLQGYLKLRAAALQKEQAGGLPAHVTDDMHGWFAKLVVDAKERAEIHLAQRTQALSGREAAVTLREVEIQRKEDRLAGREDVMRLQVAEIEQRLATSTERVAQRTIDLATASERLSATQAQLLIEREGRESAQRQAAGEREQMRQLQREATQQMSSEMAQIRNKLLEGVDGVSQSAKLLRVELAKPLEKLLGQGAGQKEALGGLVLTLGKVELAISALPGLASAVASVAQRQVAEAARTEAAAIEAHGAAPFRAVAKRRRMQATRADGRPRSTAKKKLRGNRALGAPQGRPSRPSPAGI